MYILEADIILLGFSSIEYTDFIFENTPVKVVALRDSPRIDLVGVEVGPFEEGKEYFIRFWIAKQLEKSGLVRLSEDGSISAAGLYKIQWKERIQPAYQLSPLPERFYPKLRYLLKELKEQSKEGIEKIREYERVKQHFNSG